MKKAFSEYLKGVAAGICIALGGTVFLALDNKVAGATFFTVGLFAICTLGLNLYTGKVCYVFDNDKKYALNLIPIWLGNFTGAFLTGEAEMLTRHASAFREKAKGMCETKANDTLLSLFILAVLCDILIYIAVENYKNNPHDIGKYLALLFGVTVFILSGYEHVVADMYYFTVAGMLDGRTLLCILVMTLGNSVGGVLIPLIRKFAEKN